MRSNTATTQPRTHEKELREAVAVVAEPLGEHEYRCLAPLGSGVTQSEGSELGAGGGGEEAAIDERGELAEGADADLAAEGRRRRG
jgi:hypothetical protein